VTSYYLTLFFRCFRKEKKLKIKFITLISEEFPFIAEKKTRFEAVNEWEGERKEEYIHNLPYLHIYSTLLHK